MTEDAVKIEGLTKRYGSKRVLNDLTVRLPLNRVTGVLGPNGAGKSTLFRAIMGLIHPEEGLLEVLGSKPGWQINREIAYLPDRARFYSAHTVRRAMDWAHQLLPRFEMDRARSLMEWMGLDPEMRVGAMSKGQEARLMLLLCLARDVPMIVLDEPFSGIDKISRERIIEALIENMSDREQTILISTHEIDEVESLLDYVLFLDQGQVRLAGEAEALRAEHGSMESIYRQLFR